MPSSRKPLDPVVKMGLGVLIGAFCLIGLGMFLSRPDRSIPPFSVGSQEDTVVAVHLPPWTRDDEISRLIERFRAVGKQSRDFGRMKIRPTTPNDPHGRYQRLIVLLFTDHAWTDQEVLHRYLTASSSPEDQRFRAEFESSIRGGYVLTEEEARGWLGPVTLVGAKLVPRGSWLFVESFGQRGSVNRAASKTEGVSY